MGNRVQTEPVIRFHDFQVNLETGEVWTGVRLKLQDQPFKVLAALLQRPGQIVTREELRQLIWPEESFGDFDHAINLAVTKLRGRQSGHKRSSGGPALFGVPSNCQMDA